MGGVGAPVRILLLFVLISLLSSFSVHFSSLLIISFSVKYNRAGRGGTGPTQAATAMQDQTGGWEGPSGMCSVFLWSSFSTLAFSSSSCSSSFPVIFFSKGARTKLAQILNALQTHK